MDRPNDVTGGKGPAERIAATGTDGRSGILSREVQGGAARSSRRLVRGAGVLAVLGLALSLMYCLGRGRGAPPYGPPEIVDVPEFPWPPPEASSRRDLPIEWLLSETAGATLGDLDSRLAATLASAGYVSRAYFAVPRGFAVVTQLEQIEADGSPKPDPPRWSLERGALRRFSIGDYLTRLLAADPGYVRVVVFLVTPVAFATTGEPISVAEVQAWQRTGLVTLPPHLAGVALADAPFACVALVYEFERRGAGEPAELRVPGRLGVESHLAALRFPARGTE